MAQFYNLTSFSPMGEPFSTQHGTFQGYWCTFEGVDGGVMLNKKQGNVPTTGNIYGELVQMTSKKGANYWKFKGMQTPQGVSAPTAQPAAQPALSSTQLDDMAEMLLSIKETVDAVAKKVGVEVIQIQPAAVPANTIAGQPGQPISNEILDKVGELFGV
nr:MAG TPA: hypothetical protein [Caudoviricetes sp.]